MKKLRVVIAMILMPFLYSIGCEPTYGSAYEAEFYLSPSKNKEVSSPDHFWGGEVEDLSSALEKIDANFDVTTPEGLEAYDNLIGALERLDLLQRESSQILPAVECAIQNTIFMTANTVMLAGIVMPILLQVGMDDDNWDSACALAYQTQGGRESNGFVLNKMSKDYINDHVILAEGKPIYKNGKVVLKDAKIYKTYDNGNQAQVPIYRHNRFWITQHKKDSDWVNFRPMPKDQEKRLIAEVRRINKVKDDTSMPLGRIEIE